MIFINGYWNDDNIKLSIEPNENENEKQEEKETPELDENGIPYL